MGIFGTRKPPLIAECYSCGKGVAEGDIRCASCGTAWDEDIAKCSRCASWIPSDVPSCPKCHMTFEPLSRLRSIRSQDRRILLPKVGSPEELAKKPDNPPVQPRIVDDAGANP